VARPALILFDDLQARRWEPFALTRPVGELLFGAEKLAERAARVLGLEAIGYLASEHLADFSEAGAPGVLRLDDLPVDRDLLFWCSRAIPEPGPEIVWPQGPAVYLIDERPVGLHLPAGQRPDEEFLGELHLESAPGTRVPLQGRLLDWVWDLLVDGPEQLGRDLGGAAAGASDLPAGVHREGTHDVILGRGVRIEPGAFFDTREGPIRLGDDVEVRTGTRLAGPATVGDRSRLLGGSFEQVCAGPYSYLRGEVAECVMLGYTNKAHDGYLGHSYVGRWVNLGALTTNSDLKNNYRPVRVWTPAGVQDTGSIKIGCFLGDHVKTGIGLLLSTGTVLGAGSNVYGSAMPPRYVRPFSWGEGDDLGEYRLAEFLDTTERAMVRRGIELGERGRRYLASCWHEGRGG
jgi:UDP-N-acetylglucosamine diphosphorylase/glucosamine-1-phosphate N-acetyltransferase